MANIFNTSSENHILKDERFFYPEFVPEKLPFRDEEIEELVFSLKPLSQGKKPTHLFIYGPPGTGKTVSLKFVLKELEEFSDRVKGIYINCFEYSSRHTILAKLTNFFGYPVSERGISTEEIFDRFVAVLKTKKITPFIIFDEAEQLLNEDSKKLLYDLSRLSEQFKINIGLAFISNDNFFLSKLDDRIRSSLQASSVSFEKYTHVELKEILNERAKFAFYPNAVSEGVIGLCAAHASKNMGDARIAIDVLLKSARIAERSNSKKIEEIHVRKAFMQEKAVKVEVTSTLSSQESLVLEFISKKNGVNSGEIYLALKKSYAERTLRQAISDLEEKKLIRSEKIQKGKGGSSRVLFKN
jgi:archaeal cell division control protein 6